MTVAVAVAAVAPAGPEGKHGSYIDADEESHRRETIAAIAAAAAACHHRETSVAAAAAAAACHRRETSVAAGAATAACHRRETSVAAAAAAAEACHRRETSVAVAAAAAEACHHREMPYRCPFVGLRTSYITLTCLLLLEFAALQLNPHGALQSSPQIALASLPSGHSHPPYLSKTPFTHTHTGVCATPAAGLKTHPRERDLCHLCLGSNLTQQGHAEEQSHTPERKDLKLTSAKLHTKKEAPGFIAPALCLYPRHPFAVPTAREPTRYRVWMLGRALKLTREHLAVAPCTRRLINSFILNE